MSETTPGETPVERRLRYLAADLAHDEDYSRALAAGREALAILRKWRDAGACNEESAALLARCEGDR